MKRAKFPVDPGVPTEQPLTIVKKERHSNITGLKPQSVIPYSDAHIMFLVGIARH